jgi:hypothetical protein
MEHEQEETNPTWCKILGGDMKDDTMTISFSYYSGNATCFLDFIAN